MKSSQETSVSDGLATDCRHKCFKERRNKDGLSTQKMSEKSTQKTSGKEFKIPTGILEVAKRLAELQEQAKALGLFTNDRELLDCQNCGLKEDVTFDGRLITYFGEPSGNDTGQRFKETEKDKIYICPNCGKEVEEPELEDFDFE